MGGAQLAFSALALLIVCSLVAATLGTVVLDEFAARQDDDPLGIEDAPSDLEQDLRATIEADPNAAGAMGLLADLLASDGNLTEAVSWYERALSLEPDDARLRLGFAIALGDGGKPADAELQFGRVITALDQRLAAAPTDAGATADLSEAHYYRGELYRRWQPPRVEAAVADYTRVIELGPDSVLAGRARQGLQAMGIGTPAAGDATPVPATEDAP